MSKSTKFIYLAILSALFSCTGVDSVPVIYDFFPISDVAVSEYEVQETVYPAGQKALISKYFLKVAFTQIKKEQNGDLQFYLERSKKSNVSDSYKLDSVWIGQKIGNEIVVNQNGTPQLKLIVPVNETDRWNINKYNTNALQTVKTLNVKPYEKFGTTVFDKVVEVVMQRDSSVLNVHEVYEKYAANYGLIQSASRMIDYCQSTPDCIGKKQISFGKTKFQKLIRYNGKDIR